MESLDLTSDALGDIANQCFDESDLLENEDHLDTEEEEEEEEGGLMLQGSDANNSYEKVKCPMCSRVLRLCNLEQHMKKKHQEKSHVCTQCDSRFASQGYLLWHIRFKHTEHKFGHTCEVCGEQCRLKQDLMAHYVSHKVAKGTIKCGSCSQPFRNYAMLRLHEIMMCPYLSQESHESAANESYYQHQDEDGNTENLDDGVDDDDEDGCVDDEDSVMNDILKKGNFNGDSSIDEGNRMLSEHSAESSSRNSLRTSELTNEADEVKSSELRQSSVGEEGSMYICPYCSKSFPSKGHYTIHVKRHTKPHKCDICGRGFAKNFAMESHRLTHNEVKEHHCTLCGWGFTLKQQLVKHLAEHHSEEQPLHCDLCGCRFQRQQALKRHLAQHCPQRPGQSSTEMSSDLSLPTFSQPTSAKPSTARRKSNKKGYKCTECNQVLTSVELFEKHRRSHKRFPCKLCSIAFRERFLLQLHVYSAHFNIKPYKCVICGLRFNLKAHAERHGAQHLKTQTFVCTACGLMFRNEETRKSHLDEGLCLGQRPERINVKAMVVFEKPDWEQVGISRSLMGYDVDGGGVILEELSSKDNNSTDNTDIVTSVDDESFSVLDESTSSQSSSLLREHTRAAVDRSRSNSDATLKRRSTRTRRKPAGASVVEMADRSDDINSEQTSKPSLSKTDVKLSTEDEDSNVSMVPESKTEKTDEPERGPNGRLIYRCHICSRPSTKRSSLATHLARVHGVGGEPFRCFICGQGNVSEYKMLQHFELHVPYRRHVCHKCGARFSAYRSLRRHKRIGKCMLNKGKHPGDSRTATGLESTTHGQKKFCGNYMARLEDDGSFEIETDVLEVEYVDESVLDVYLASNPSTIKSEPYDYDSADESLDNSTDAKSVRMSASDCKQEELDWNESIGIKQEIDDDDNSHTDDINCSSLKVTSASDVEPDENNRKNSSVTHNDEGVPSSELNCNENEPLNGKWNATSHTGIQGKQSSGDDSEDTLEDTVTKDSTSSPAVVEPAKPKLIDAKPDKYNSALQLPLHVKILRSKSLPHLLKGILSSSGFNVADIMGVSEPAASDPSGDIDSGDGRVREVVLINGVAYDDWFKKALEASRTGEKPAVSGNKDTQDEYEQFEVSGGWCAECNKHFVTKYRYRNHMQRHCDARRFTCKFCHKEFKTPEDRKVHERWHDPKRILACSVCDMKFICSSTLRHHMRCHSGEKPHKCDTCGRTFRRKYDLNTHASIHTGELPFKCSLCDKQFRLQPSLNDHMRIHNGNKPYECSICKKQFAQRGNWRTHERRHLGIKKYTCERCNKSFVQNYELQNHRLRCVTQDLPFSCLLCGMRFTLENPLKIHLERHSCRLCGLQFVDMKMKVTHQYKCRSEAKQRAKEAIKNNVEGAEKMLELAKSTSRKGTNSAKKSTNNKRKSSLASEENGKPVKAMRTSLTGMGVSLIENDCNSSDSPDGHTPIDYNIDVSRIKEELESDNDDSCVEFESNNLNNLNYEADDNRVQQQHTENSHDTTSDSIMRVMYQHKSMDLNNLDANLISGNSIDYGEDADTEVEDCYEDTDS